jgi:flagellar biosynthetic protein FliQ
VFGPQTVLTLAQQAMEVTLMVSAPLLLAALVTGLVVSILQAATQINEMTLSFIPKLIAMFAVLVFTGPWMLETMVDYMRRLFTQIPLLIG